MTLPTIDREHAARTRVRSIVAVGVLFLALGVLDVWRGLAPLAAPGHPASLASDDVLVLMIGIAALIGGTFVIRGHHWARWLLACWMALHVAISVGRPAVLLAHLAIFGSVAFVLFRPRATAHFRGRRAIGAVDQTLPP